MSALSTVPAWLQQRWHFETSPWAALRRFGLATGLVLLLLFWLQPFGGERYRAPWWALRLLGYGVCLLLAVLPMRAWALRRRARQPLWRLQDELQALAIWAACSAGLSYAHSCWLVSPRTPSWVDFFMFSLVFALPFLLMLLPLLLWQGRADVLAVQLAAPTAESQASTTAPAAGTSPQIVVQGRNRDEQLCFRREQLVCAQAQQNYVRLQLEAEDGSGIQAHLLRLPLGELAAALAAGETACWRVHRSWLVAPERVQAWVQTGRQRQLRLRGLDALIPVSADFELPPELPSAGLDATQIRP
ncbi:LytTR family transcriptional regulator DNA-binding domain-containing protein [Paucibacter sp. B51]|uniref:LytTR family transcriptional regulator DNA-binding domain-containing protein n=1 Tax=Paucibacter sp. B51 TaxID=2993315 RepID=UPI0022EBDCC6|nr:LytTR family transcriptional regulator DNA-binding domain-containing protein [Paucibacter sp. B51]